ncbi:MAG: HAMP domain-containing protein [Thermodesulfobacteriota bacterium]
MLIERGFRARFIIKFCLLIIAGVLMLGSVLYLIGHKELGTTYSQAISTIIGLKNLLIPTIIVTIFIQIVILCLITIFLTLYTSHKVAGPVYRLERSFKEVEEGNLAINIHFRTDDQMKELERAFNEMALGINGMVADIRKGFYKTKGLERRLKEVIDKEGPLEKLRPILQDLKKESGKLKKRINREITPISHLPKGG